MTVPLPLAWMVLSSLKTNGEIVAEPGCPPRRCASTTGRAPGPPPTSAASSSTAWSWWPAR
ncbi:hypothetical protein V2I01_00365 [Micromonospora sp. BRA006-A]|nr:hypothetical protein [Micromonospora sp. BRA006-A]